MARHRLDGTPVADDEQVDHQRNQAIEDFKLLLAVKIEIAVRAELLLGASYFWHEDGPAVEFTLDSRRFLLVREADRCLLLVKADGQSSRLAELPVEDSHFEDQLLVALGDALDPVALY
jgi:hypothetical protein